MINGENIKNIMQELAKEHINDPFRSEADFQHALAWKLHKMNENQKGFDIRLECPLRDNITKKNIHLDIFISKPKRIGLELKYKTTAIPEFNIVNHGACDCGRYDFLADVHRLEKLKENDKIDKGFAIFLTNESKYWTKTKTGSIDELFKIYDARELKAKENLDWDKKASNGTKRNREIGFNFNKNYLLKWHDFSKDSKFRYLLVEIK